MGINILVIIIISASSIPLVIAPAASAIKLILSKTGIDTRTLPLLNALNTNLKSKLKLRL
jgi:hypothetical protein